MEILIFEYIQQHSALSPYFVYGIVTLAFIALLVTIQTNKDSPTDLYRDQATLLHSENLDKLLKDKLMVKSYERFNCYSTCTGNLSFSKNFNSKQIILRVDGRSVLLAQEDNGYAMGEKILWLDYVEVSDVWFTYAPIHIRIFIGDTIRPHFDLVG